MSTRATVLYDAPGPKGRRNNLILTIVTTLIFLAVVAWILSVLHANGQLEAAKWKPFIQQNTWSTYILPGLQGTVFAAVTSIVLACLIGGLLGLGRLATITWVRWICGVIVEIFRAIPVLLLMIFAYQLFAVYDVVPSSQLAFAAVVFGLTMYNGSVIAEILRSGIKSLPKGQMEAARALGLSHNQTMVRVLLPQAVAAMLPALVAQMVIALKDSALGYQIGYVEVVRSGIQAASFNQNFLASLAVVGIIMILINYALTALAGYVEKRLRAGRSRKNPFRKTAQRQTAGQKMAGKIPQEKTQ